MVLWALADIGAGRIDGEPRDVAGGSPDVRDAFEVRGPIACHLGLTPEAS